MAKATGVRFWQISEALGISETAMTRLFRHELSPDQKTEIRGFIQKLSKAGETNVG